MRRIAMQGNVVLQIKCCCFVYVYMPRSDVVWPLAWVSLLFEPHEFRRLGLIRRIQELGHDQGELFEVDRLGNIRVEARFYALGVDIAKHVGRESNDGDPLVSVLLLPAADLFAGLVAVFVGHVKIAL